MKSSHYRSSIILIFLGTLVYGCNYTQLIKLQPAPARGNVIDIYPSEYEVEILDSSQIKDDYIVIDSFCVEGDVQNAIYQAWKRDADAIADIHYEHRYITYADDPVSNKITTIFGTLIKYLVHIFPCDSPVVTIKFQEPSWIVATVKKYNDSIVFRINDEKIDRIELATNYLDPGIYEIHVVVGENPIWTRRGWYWETSRWIEIQ
jgi:hypothetical protein